MRRIRTILLLATFLIAFSISPARAVPVEGPDGSFYELVSTAVAGPAARAAALAASYQDVPDQLAITSAAVDSLLAGLAPIGWLVGMVSSRRLAAWVRRHGRARQQEPRAPRDGLHSCFKASHHDPSGPGTHPFDAHRNDFSRQLLQGAVGKRPHTAERGKA